MKKLRKFFPSRAAMLLLMTMLTSLGAWATQWATSLSGNATDGWYINMPANGTATSIDNAAVLDLSSSSVTSFNLYDDGGKGGGSNNSSGNYSNNYSGYLVITAPTGCVINISGNIITEKNCDKLTVWDGTDTTNESKKLLNGVSSDPTKEKTAITTVTSTGNVITVYFYSDKSSNCAGLDLTVKIENPYDLEYATITSVNSFYLYTGSAISITPMVKDALGTPLTLGTHYTATLNDNSVTSFPLSLAAGDYTLTVTAKDGSGYTGSQSVSFSVVNPNVSLSGNATDGYYINMPAKGYATTIDDAAILTLDGSVTTFKLYDDGGKDGYYSLNYSGYLVITAPEDYALQLSGSIKTNGGFLTVYDSGDASGTKLVDAVGGIYEQQINVISNGRTMTIYFYSIGQWNDYGLDLTVTLIPIDTHDLQNATISGVNESYFYTGSAISITPTVTAYNGTTLTLGTHYTATLNDNSVTSFPLSLAAGDYTLTVTGISPYTGSQSVSFTVIPEGLNIDNDYSKGQVGYYYVNMPKNGGTSTTETYKTVTLTSDFTSAFKVYDDGGKGSNYSNGCNGYLVINAPTGYRIQVSGTVKTESSTTDYLRVYDGDRSGSSYPGYLGTGDYGGFDGSNPVSIGTLTTTGNAMTLFFNSYKEGNTDTGLNLTVTLVPPTQYDITIDKTGLPDGCDVVANKLTAAPYTNVTLTATAATGYVMTSLEVTDADGNAVDVDWDIFTTNDATFEMPASAVTVKPTFNNAKTADDGLAINMPKTGTKTAIIPDGVTSFKIYDDGGPGGSDDTSDAAGNYSNNYNGTLVLTAPTGYKIKLVGSVTIVGSDYLTIENGSEIKNPSASVNLISTGTSLTLIFHSDESENRSGFLIRATLLDENTEYAVTVNNPSKGGTVSASINDENVTSAKLHQTVTLTVNTADGYQFDGISAVYTNDNFTPVTLTKVDDTHYTLTMPDAAVTVTPTFSTIDYTIAYVLGDEAVTFTPAAETYTVETEDITLGTPEWTGHTFGGWYKNDQFEGDAVTTLAKGSFGNKTFYAKWTVNTYTVAFDKNATDANGTMDPQEFTYGTAQNLTTNAFTRPGYAFNGWNTQADGNGTTYTDQQEVNNLTTEAGATVTLYAQWMFESWTGSGDTADPYIISSREALNKLASDVNNGTEYTDVYFKVTADINYTGAPMSYDGGNSNYVAIGDKDHKFRGHFDGDGHTIRGIRINKNANYQGLFGYMGGAVVKNVVLADTRITIGSSNYYAGGIAGRTTRIGDYGYNTIENCHVGSDVYIIGLTGGSEGSDVGGIVGENSGYIRHCTSAATVSGNEKVGAIMGYHAQMSMENCLVLNATVNGTKYAGAIVGYMAATALKHNYYNSGTTVNGSSASGKGTGNHDDYTTNDGAVPATVISDDAAVPTSLSGTVAFRREFKGGAASTIVLPFNHTAGTEGSYYEFSGVTNEGGKWIATMTQVYYSTLYANKPYVFKAAGTEAHQPILFHGAANYSAAGTNTSVGDWSFVGTYARKDWTSENYGKDYGFAAADATGLNGEDIKAGDFVKFGPGAWVRPMRSYLTFTGSAEPWASAPTMNRAAASDLPNSISVVLIDADGTVTKIDAADLGIEFDTTAWYDLNGRRLNGKPTAKGLYINNGKKVVIK